MDMCKFVYGAAVGMILVLAAYCAVVFIGAMYTALKVASVEQMAVLFCGLLALWFVVHAVWQSER